jgi:predicted PolB exonuclease-like 3'-5' exonuclease
MFVSSRVIFERLAAMSSSSPDDFSLDDDEFNIDLGDVATAIRPEREVSKRDEEILVSAGEMMAATSAASAAPIIASAGGSVLYVDIETIPDYDRQHLFGLPPLPVVPSEQSVDELLAPAEFLSQTAKEIETWLNKNNPCEEWLQQCEAAERATTGRSGNRKTIFELLKNARSGKDAVEIALKSNRKKMSVTPEMAKICAMGLACDDGQVVSAVAGIDGVTEKGMLEAFWFMAKRCQHICGFNVAGFDLPTIFFRSIMLGIPASRMIDLSPYKDQVIDLMVARFGRNGEKGMGLKNVAKLCDIQVPCEGTDGSQVEELFRTNPHLVGQYVASDVIVTRKLHRIYSGFFCV